MFKIITDSGADFREEQARALDIEIAHLKITFEDEVIIQRREEDVSHFFTKLKAARELPFTSQPSPKEFYDLYEKYPGEELLVLTLSGSLSGTLNSAELARKELNDPERVHIVDTRQATLSQNVVIAEAIRLRDAGKTARETADLIRELAGKTTILGLIDTLKYLKKGGRIPASLAAIGSIMNMKPVVELKDGALITAGKARGHQAGLKLLSQRLAELGIDPRYKVFIGTTDSEKYRPEIEGLMKAQYPDVEYEFAKIGGIIGTHIGPDCIGVGFVKKNPD